MVKNSKLKIILGLGLFSLFAFVGSFIMARGIYDTAYEKGYIRGYTGKYCYVTGEHPKNINEEKALYFDSYQDCKESL